ncbi:hypothetical protein FACS1894104_4080 [Actinomycetota bacterium]|nr:hypothetical protein FACS1894104_4080 [Actinomycetota bacterium]
MIRGPYKSYSYQQIDSQVSSLVSSGIKEIILIGQDTSIWGTDFGALGSNSSNSSKASPNPSSLANLLNELAITYPNTWFRVMYLQPQKITTELLSVMARHNNICNYLDIPLQHANARIIKEMHRSGNGGSAISWKPAVLTKLRMLLLSASFLAQPKVTNAIVLAVKPAA